MAPSYNETLNNINRNVQSVQQSAQNVSQQATQQTDALRGIQFNTTIAAAAGVVTAFNTAKQARLQKEQLSIQHAMAAQAAAHQFAMWRQTPDGIAFVEWQARATDLVYILRYRQAIWRDAWQTAVANAKAQVSQDEVKRIGDVNKQSKIVIIAVIAIIAFAIAVFVGLPAGKDAFIELFTRWSGESAEQNAMRDTAAIVNFAILFFIPLAVGIVSITLWSKKSKKEKIKKSNLSAQCEADRQARVAKWGFDPLGVPPTYIGFSWTNYSKVDEYTQRIENLVINGQTSFPAAHTLPELIVPSNYPPNENHPQTVNEALRVFSVEYEQLSCE